MKRLLIIAGLVVMFTMTGNISQAAEGQGQPQRPAQGQARGQVTLPGQPVSRAMELNRRKNQFIVRTVTSPFRW